MHYELKRHGNKEPIWSILTCLTPSREEMWAKLLTNLLTQIGSKPVEIVTISDECVMKIGLKRNMLLNQARGKYISFVDSDDGVGDKYIESQLPYLYRNPDCLSLEGICHRKGLAEGRHFVHALWYTEWSEGTSHYIRTPGHWNVIRKDLALKASFPNNSWGEDKAFSDRIRPMLNTMYWIPNINYYYLDEGSDGATSAERERRRKK